MTTTIIIIDKINNKEKKKMNTVNKKTIWPVCKPSKISQDDYNDDDAFTNAAVDDVL